MNYDDWEAVYSISQKEIDKLKLAAAHSRKLSEFFKCQVNTYLASDDYTKVNKVLAKSVLNLYNKHFPTELFEHWNDNEPHRPQLAAALALKIDPSLSNKVAGNLAMGTSKSVVDGGPARVFWINTGVPLDPILTAQFYNTMEGK